MSTGKKVLIIGPGFIGWNILDLLVAEGYSVTGFVRRKDRADGIKASGASSVVMGDLNDKSIITEQTSQHDITIHTATADHLPSVEAVLDGIKQRTDKGKMTIFLHTSGTLFLGENAMGAFKGEKIYRDDEPGEIDAVPDDAPHRPIDLAILRARKDLGDKAKIAIMIPPLVYGWTHDRGTVQIPTLTRFALKHGYVPLVGKGLPVWSNIHVLDLARAYVALLHHLESSAAASTLENPYYFCEGTGDDEPSWYDVAALIGMSLHSRGLISDPKPRELEGDSMYGELFGPFTPAVVGLNSRSRAVRLRKLGWEPREKDWKASYVEDELPNILKEEMGYSTGYNPNASLKS